MDQKQIKKRIEKLERELEKVRGREYELPFGSAARARVSRKWDALSREKFELQKQLISDDNDSD
jgi:hypothetical protein